jgi:hypothetical protein
MSESRAQDSLSSADLALEKIITQLAQQAQDVDQSLDQFMSQRSAILQGQKKAIADYEAEMYSIDHEGEEPIGQER